MRTRVTNRQLPMKAHWWDIPLGLRDLAEAIPIISDNGLQCLTESNFQNPLLPFPPVYWYLGYLLNPFINPPPPALLFGKEEYINVLKYLPDILPH